MSIKPLLLVSLLLASMHGHSEAAIPDDLFAEIRTLSHMSPGDIVYVDFWASWCNPCRKSFPWMNAMHRDYQARGLKVLAINVDQERELAEAFLNVVPTEFTVSYDGDGRLAKAFQLQGMPSSFIIDDQGHVRVSHKGFFEAKTLAYEQEIQSLLTK